MAHLGRSIPVLAELPIQSSWWGYYEVSPDWNALVGEAEEPRGFYYATGFSGPGFQQPPAVEPSAFISTKPESGRPVATS